MILTGTTTVCQNSPGSNGNEKLLHILQSSRNGASPSGVVWSRIKDTRWEVLPSAKMQLVYSTASAKSAWHT